MPDVKSRELLRYLSRLNHEERWELLNTSLTRLLDLGEVRYVQDDVDADEGVEFRPLEPKVMK